MIPNYPDDSHAQTIDTTMRAVEGYQSHLYVVGGTSTISCTTNTLQTATVTFARQFTANTTPLVMLTISSLGNTTSVIKSLSTASISNTQFTIQLLTDTTQSITVSWVAVGSAA